MGLFQNDPAGLSRLHALRPQASHADLSDGQPGPGRASAGKASTSRASRSICWKTAICCTAASRRTAASPAAAKGAGWKSSIGTATSSGNSSIPATSTSRTTTSSRCPTATCWCWPWRRRRYEDCLAAGFDPRMMRDEQLFPEFFIEVQPTRPKGGKIVWEWHVWDHLIQHNDRTKANYGDVAKHPELIDVNCNGRATPAFWNHGNSIAYNAQLDQIMLSARGCNEIWVVDHGTTTAGSRQPRRRQARQGGRPALSLGQPGRLPARLRARPPVVPATRRPVDSRGLPRRGPYPDLQQRPGPRLFDHRGDRAAHGRPAATTCCRPSGAYGPAQPVWHYQAENPEDFYSSEISGAHRLPNGNTLICAGVKGTFFEVTPAGRNGVAVRQSRGSQRHPGPGRAARARITAGTTGTPCSRSIATSPITPAWPART